MFQDVTPVQTEGNLIHYQARVQCLAAGFTLLISKRVSRVSDWHFSFVRFAGLIRCIYVAVFKVGPNYCCNGGMTSLSQLSRAWFNCLRYAASSVPPLQFCCTLKQSHCADAR